MMNLAPNSEPDMDKNISPCDKKVQEITLTKPESKGSCLTPNTLSKPNFEEGLDIQTVQILHYATAVNHQFLYKTFSFEIRIYYDSIES